MKTIKVKGVVECPHFVGSERDVWFEFLPGTVASPQLLKFKDGVAKFSIRVPVGTETIRAKTAWSLAHKLPIGDSLHFILRGGDINNDNRVNIRDTVAFKAAETTGDLLADINGDGIVDGADFEILKSNLGQAGDPK